MKALAWVLVILMLTGCASASIVGSDASYEDRYAAARLVLNDAIMSVIIYSQKPRCSEAIIVGCSDQSVIDKAYDATVSADMALDAARLALDGGDDNAVLISLNVAIAILAQIQAVLTAELTTGA